MPCKMFWVATTECSIFTAVDPAVSICCTYSEQRGEESLQLCVQSSEKPLQELQTQKVLQNKPSSRNACEYIHLTTERHRSVYTSLNFHMQHTARYLLCHCWHWHQNQKQIWFKNFHHASFLILWGTSHVDISAKMTFLRVRRSARTAINSRLKTRGQHQSVI